MANDAFDPIVTKTKNIEIYECKKKMKKSRSNVIADNWFILFF